MSDVAYTYRGGARLELRKAPDEFVVRVASAAAAAPMGVAVERTSTRSFRVRVADSTLDRTMDAVREAAVVHHAYYHADSGAEFLITDRVLVRFRPGTPTARMDEFAARYGLILVSRFEGGARVYQLTESTGTNPLKLVVQVTEQESQLVESIDHDLNQRMKRSAPLPTDAYFREQWHLHDAPTGAELSPMGGTRCVGAWQLLGGYGSRDVVIGMTDDGCAVDHPDFDSEGKFAGWAYFDPTSPDRLLTHRDGWARRSMMGAGAGGDHGTPCAGVAAAEADAAHVVGVAPACRLYPVRWPSDERALYVSDSRMLTVLDRVASEVDVLSNSWGNRPTTTWATEVVARVRALGTSGGRRGKGVVFLWAAGNENCPLTLPGPAAVDVPFTAGIVQDATGQLRWIGFPRGARSKDFSHNLVGVPGVAFVAATTSEGRRSHYSNYGGGVEFCAPSSNVHTYRRMQLPGLDVSTDDRSGGVRDDFGGTSSATPLVAGIAALVIGANPDLSASEVLSVLRSTASRALDVTPWAKTPPAAYDPNPSWDVSPVAPYADGTFRDIGHPDGTWSPWFGFGRVDAAAAVAEAMRRRAVVTLATVAGAGPATHDSVPSGGGRSSDAASPRTSGVRGRAARR